jgi:hypothetical protein
MDLRLQIDESGYAIVDPAIAPDAIDALIRAVDAAENGGHRSGQGGIRDALRRLPDLPRIINHPAVIGVVRATLGRAAFAVRGVLFDKNAAANWKVPWHQDLTVAVRARTDVDGYGPWSLKAGVPHVQPPAHVLEQMLAVRLHLDNCGTTNGPVRVLAGTHRLGRLSSEAITEAQRRHQEVTCSVGRGGLLAMRPLLLHASSAAVVAQRRRVLHLEFAACELAPGLEWFERWQCTA